MSSLMPLTALVLLLGAGPTAADEKGDKPAEVAAYFHDGTVIHGAVVRESVEITTRFGKLAVPLGEIRRIEFGHRVPADVAGKIEDAIKRLGHEQFPQREAAGKGSSAMASSPTRPSSRRRRARTRKCPAVPASRSTRSARRSPRSSSNSAPRTSSTPAIAFSPGASHRR